MLEVIIRVNDKPVKAPTDSMVYELVSNHVAVEREYVALDNGRIVRHNLW